MGKHKRKADGRGEAESAFLATLATCGPFVITSRGNIRVGEWWGDCPILAVANKIKPRKGDEGVRDNCDAQTIGIVELGLPKDFVKNMIAAADDKLSDETIESLRNEIITLLKPKQSKQYNSIIEGD